MKPTQSLEYTKRLQSLQDTLAARIYNRANPYRWHIRRLINGPTLEVGCGIGRVMKFAPTQITGIDHNLFSVEMCRKSGLNAWESAEFEKNHQKKSFSTLLTSHVLEHLSVSDSINLLRVYTNYLQNGSRIIIITPQEKGYSSDQTHVTFVDFQLSKDICAQVGIEVQKQYSFPFVRSLGKYFIYNEFITIGFWRG